jgi:kynureninase
VSDPLLTWRERFPILARTTYLISNSLGAMPRETADAVASYAGDWAERGVRAWAEGWWDLPVTVGDEVAPLIGAPPGTVTMHQNVSIATQVVLSCFDWSGSRNRIVCMEPDFPSVLYNYRGQERRGAEVVMVPGRGDGVGIDIDRVCESIDDRTALVAVSHVLFRSSFIVDVRPIVERAREAGAMVLWDIYQSAGSMPVEAEAAGVDFAVGGCLKWLCGGPGAGFLYVRRDRIAELEPAFTGWQADREPFSFRPGAVDYREDVWRFLNGTPHVPALYACRPGLRILREVGMEAVRAKSMRQTARLVEATRERGWSVTVSDDPTQRGGAVAIDPPYSFEVAKELLAREVIVDFRPGAGIRISPHFYTSDDECDRVVAEIASILDDGSWKKHVEADRTVT